MSVDLSAQLLSPSAFSRLIVQEPSRYIGRMLQRHTLDSHLPSRSYSLTALLPVMVAVFIAFITIGFALPVLPLHLHHGLGLSMFMVGLVTGSQFAAAIISRVWAGNFADTRGAKQAVVIGLLTAVASGLLYLMSLAFTRTPEVAVSMLLLARAVLGGAESFIITGAVTWGLGLLGPENAGRVIAWMGMAMFAAFALGAALGTSLYDRGGFFAVALATTLVPLVTLLLVAPLAAVSRTRRAGRPALMRVARAVWMPGVGSALSSIGFGAVLAFSALLAKERGWEPVWLPFGAFAAALVAARALLGHVPDTLGGAKVALVSVVIEAVGLALIWSAAGSLVAVIGAALTGFGYALVYPGLGVEAVRRAPPESRGLAMGTYTVFLDVALGFGTPVLGLIGGWAGLGAIFLASALAVLAGSVLTARLLSAPLAEKGQL
jgi:MFS family permease